MNSIEPANRTPETKSFVSGVSAFVSSVALSGSGCDTEILGKYGSAQCRTKQLSAGYIAFGAAGIAMIGAAVKTFLMASGLFAIPLALIVGLVYGLLIFHIERALTGGVSAFWPVKTKLKAFVLRAPIALVTAFFSAAPIILLALDSQVQARLASFELQARQEARSALEKIHGIDAVAAKTSNLAAAAKEAGLQVHVLPESVIEAQQLATNCEQNAEALFATNKRKASVLRGKLPPLVNIQMASASTDSQKAAAKRSSDEVNARIVRLADEVAAKNVECRTSRAQAEEGKTRYIADATAKSQRADKELEEQKTRSAAIATALGNDVAKADVVAKIGNTAQSGADVKAAVAVIREDAYARILVIFIWLGFFIIDVACFGVKLISKPGPYDDALLQRDSLSRMASRSRIREAESEDLITEAETAAKVRGVTQFHETDKGAVFAVAEQHKYDEQQRVAEYTRDIRMAKAQSEEIVSLATNWTLIQTRVAGNPALVRRLEEALLTLRGVTGPGATS